MMNRPMRFFLIFLHITALYLISFAHSVSVHAADFSQEQATRLELYQDFGMLENPTESNLAPAHDDSAACTCAAGETCRSILIYCSEAAPLWPWLPSKNLLIW
jgi:hypothetical protein